MIGEDVEETGERESGNEDENEDDVGKKTKKNKRRTADGIQCCGQRRRTMTAKFVPREEFEA